MTTSSWALQPPVTLTLTAPGWHQVLRDLVYAVSSVEAVEKDVKRTADPRRDAWVIAQHERLRGAARAIDDVLELLSDAEARPVPPGRRSQ